MQNPEAQRDEPTSAGDQVNTDENSPVLGKQSEASMVGLWVVHDQGIPDLLTSRTL